MSVIFNASLKFNVVYEKIGSMSCVQRELLQHFVGF